MIPSFLVVLGQEVCASEPNEVGPQSGAMKGFVWLAEYVQWWDECSPVCEATVVSEPAHVVAFVDGELQQGS